MNESSPDLSRGFGPGDRGILLDGVAALMFGDRISLGRGRSSSDHPDVPLLAYIRGLHALLSRAATGGWMLAAAHPRAQLAVNGAELEPGVSRHLEDGDVLRLGQPDDIICGLRYRQSQSEDSGSAMLFVLPGSNPVRFTGETAERGVEAIVLLGSYCRIGHSRMCDVPWRAPACHELFFGWNDGVLYTKPGGALWRDTDDMTPRRVVAPWRLQLHRRTCLCHLEVVDSSLDQCSLDVIRL